MASELPIQHEAFKIQNLPQMNSLKTA